MCQLTCDTGDFWREVFTAHAKPVSYGGFTFHRSPDRQAEVDAQAKRIADASVRELRAKEANDKAIFEAFENVPTNIFLRRPHLRGAIADAFRAGDQAQLGKIVADEIRAELQDKARDAAEEEIDP